ncbi:MAG: hypothetical protein Q4B82_05725 [Alysiella sp.]|uniref:hypothetical protein n=1 Tax=Alysiella sp. TaxID=1872483 RepID=UPI0026DA88B2|nr:hypothetical protein [Alysiella sp.]MDO4434063.1 hypothetical protein [Alysiella sp.]
MEIFVQIIVYALLGFLALQILFGVLVLLFEFLCALPAIMGLLLLILAFGLPIYLAFEVNGWLILIMPVTLGVAGFILVKCEDYYYAVRKHMKKQAAQSYQKNLFRQPENNGE